MRKGYTFATFKKDLLAGVTVGIIALPLAMAFAIASGVNPDRGLFTAIVAGFLISALGGSRVQIGGPTGAFVVIVYGIIQRTGYEGLCISTVIAAVILIVLGIFRIGTWIKYVPYPLITGFTTGIALLIFSTQIKDFFGLQMASVPAEFMGKWEAYIHHFHTLNFVTVSISAGTLAFILLIRRFVPRIPWGISAIVLATAATWLFHIPIETIQSRFGEVPRGLPLPSLPCLSIPISRLTLTDAFTIAFLGGIESLLSAVIGDGMIGGNHRSNCELVAQGIANFGSIIFGGIPATGAIARTAANVKTGAQTPVAGMIHALTLLAILVCLAPLVSHIPLAALSAVLMMVAWNMSEAPHFIHLLRASANERLVLLSAFLLTVFVDITVAISVGMILASFLFMKRMSQASKVISLSQVFKESPIEFPEKQDIDDLSHKSIPFEVEVYEIQGPFFFGSANILKNLLNQARLPKIFILRMRTVPFIDSTALFALKEFYHHCKKKNITLLLSGVHGQTLQDLKNFGLYNIIGPENIFPHIDAALERTSALISRLPSP